VDDKQIMNELRGLALTEPLLGFDPDDVATKAAKRVRNRRATLGVGVSTLAMIGAGVLFVAPGGGPGQLQSASGGSSSSSPAPRSPGPDNSKGPALKVDLTAQQARNLEHLREVLPTVLPGATDISVAAFEQPSDSDSMTATVDFRDSAGPASFTLTIAGTAGGGTKPLASLCSHPLTGPDGKPLRCDKIPQPDGSTVVVQESGIVDLKAADDNNVTDTGSLDAVQYRTDGTTVGVLGDRVVRTPLAEKFNFTNPDGSIKILRSRAPLTEQQLVTFVTDPAFNLK
jgi:hypothetical protein